MAATSVRALVAIAILLNAGAATGAQESRAILSGLASLEGPERERRLIEGARREGGLTLYSTFTVEDLAALNAPFEARYGVKVRLWRAASEKVLQRTLAEAKAGRDEVDVVDCNSVPLELLRREG